MHETPPSTVHPRKNLLAIPSSRKPTDLGIAEVKVVRDPKTGAILSVQHSKPARDNPLGDPLNELSDAEDENSGGKIERGERGIVADLEEMVKCGKPKRPRMQSQREREWIERLVKRWGDDWGGMFRDRRMNPQQQTEGDLKRRVGVWKAAKRKGGQGED